MNNQDNNEERSEINELLNIEDADVTVANNNTDDIIHIEKNDRPHNASDAINRDLIGLNAVDDETIEGAPLTAPKITIDFDKDAIMSIIESALYVSGNEGISVPDMKRITGLPAELVRKVLKEMM